MEPDEIVRLGRDLTQILDYIALLDEVDTAGVEPMAHAIDLHNVFRDDTNTESLPREDALRNAPVQDERFFRVPPILNNRE